MQQLISVIVPAYNDPAGYLRECLESLRAQTYEHWEAIVIDDGSTSGHDIGKMVREQSDCRIQLVRHAQNRGLSAARNTGIATAQGTLLAMVDSDDRVSPDFLSETAKALEIHPDCDAAYGNFRLFGRRNEALQFLPTTEEGGYRVRDLRDVLERHFLHRHIDGDHHLWQAPVESLEPSLHLRYLLPPGAGVLLKRKMIDRIGEYGDAPELKLGLEDWDYWLCAAEAGVVVVHIAREFYWYRQHTASMISRVNIHEHRIREVMVRRHEPLLRRLGLREQVLATGYRRSAAAAIRRSSPLQAASLALRALRLDPGGFARALTEKARVVKRAFGGGRKTNALASVE